MSRDLINKLKDLLFDFAAQDTNENLAKLMEFLDGKVLVKTQAIYKLIGLRKEIIADFLSEKVPEDLMKKYTSKLEEIEELFEEGEGNDT